MLAKNFSRQEMRYRFGKTTKLEAALTENLGKPRSYSIRTEYLDYPEGTWSKGNGDTKYRLRRYVGDTTLWYETKKRVGDRTIKHREKIAPNDPRLKEIKTILIASYDRTAWEKGGVRVTIDRHLVFSYEDGALIPLIKRTVEVKCKSERPEWLNEAIGSRKRVKGKWRTAERLRRRINE
jgi:hypothetical protein